LILVDTDQECLRLIVDNWLLITFQTVEMSEKALLTAYQLRRLWKHLIHEKLSQVTISFFSMYHLYNHPLILFH
jgi:hypothetical protein